MEKNKIGAFHFVTEPYQLDFQGRMTIPMIGSWLMRAASVHASQRGFGFSDMTERHTAWVLSRLAIEMNAYPAMGETVTLRTWVDEVGRLFTSRCFELTGDDGQPYGYARSIWAAIDLQTRRPTPLDVTGLSGFITDRSCPIEKPGKITPIEGHTEGIPYTVRYSDIDINGHLNSVKYMEHLLDLFDLEMFRTHTIRRFEIAYQAEGHYGMELMLHQEKVGEEIFNMAICHNEKAICRAAVTWR